LFGRTAIASALGPDPWLEETPSLYAVPAARFRIAIKTDLVPLFTGARPVHAAQS
jgi:hypothetical protein